jgi:hypothetical protein
MFIINGRRVERASMTGDEITRMAAPGPGRRVVVRYGVNAHPVDASRNYSPKDKDGKPLSVKTIPDRTKGSITP